MVVPFLISRREPAPGKWGCGGPGAGKGRKSELGVFLNPSHVISLDHTRERGAGGALELAWRRPCRPSRTDLARARPVTRVLV